MKWNGRSQSARRAAEGQLQVAIVAPSLRVLGGQAVQAQRLLDGWAGDANIRAWLVPHNPALPAPFHRLLAIKYVRTAATQLRYWPLLVQELRRADVVHVFSASYWSFLLAPLPAALVGRLLGKPVILNYRSGEAPDHIRRSAVARATLRHTSMNVVPSAFLQQVFQSYQIPADVVPNLIDLRRFPFRARDPLRPHLLSTRNFEPLYNVACTVRAFARVQAQVPEATLTLVGGGTQEAELRDLAARLKLRHVTFAGQVPPAEIARYYDRGDIYVQTPSIDNMPGSLVEAFASGLPVVATSVGGVPVILTHGQHGLLAPDNDDAAVAGLVLTLLARPAYARQLAAAAFETCRAYEWPVVRERWLSAYRSVLSAHRGIVVSTPSAEVDTAAAQARPPVVAASPQPIRIAVVVDTFDPGGTEQQMCQLIRRLDRSRFTVHAVCLRRRGMYLPQVEASGAIVTEMPLSSFRSLASARLALTFARWCEAQRIDVVQACDLYANIFALPAAALARVPLRIGSRRGIVNPTRTRGLLTLQRLAYHSAHRVVANSRAAARCLLDEGVAASKVLTIANGIDFDQFRPAPRRECARVITTVANLRAGKGHDVLLRALARLALHVPDLHANLIGDGPLRPALEQLTADLGLTGRVTFLGHRADVPARLAESDLFAFASFMEASPNAVIEAMAAGLPVVATRVGGIPELVEHGQNGLLVPPHDAEALAASLLQLIEHPDEAARMGDAARDAIHMRYSFDRMVGEFEALYLQGLARRTAAEPASVARQDAA